MIYGYIRVSTDKQTVENQRYEILTYCRNNDLVVDSWYEDVESGKVQARKRKVGSILRKAREGDTLIVSEITRIGRGMFDIMSVLRECMDRKIKIIAIKEKWHLGDDLQSKLMAMCFGMCAEIERTLISQRTKEGLARRRAEGVILGRPKGSLSATVKLTGREMEIQHYLEKRLSYSAIARMTGVHRHTVTEFVQRNNLRTY